MLSLLLATLLTQATMSPTSDLSTNRVRATGASVTRALNDRFAETINVKDFGACGNGTCDDTVAIQGALNAARPGTRVFLPAGRYRITSALTPPKTFTNGGAWGSVVIEGSANARVDDLFGSTNYGSTIFMASPSADVPVLSLTATRGIRLHRLNLVGTYPPVAGSVAVWVNGYNKGIVLDEVTIAGFQEHLRIGSPDEAVSGNDDEISVRESFFFHGGVLGPSSTAIVNNGSESYSIRVSDTAFQTSTMFRGHGKSNGTVMNSFKCVRCFSSSKVVIKHETHSGAAQSSRDIYVIDQLLWEPSQYAGSTDVGQLFISDSLAANNPLGLVVTNSTLNTGSNAAEAYDPAFRMIRYYGRGPFIFRGNKVGGYQRLPFEVVTEASGWNDGPITFEDNVFTSARPAFIRPKGSSMPSLFERGNTVIAESAMSASDGYQASYQMGEATVPISRGRRHGGLTPRDYETWVVGSTYTDSSATPVEAICRTSGTTGTITGVAADVTAGLDTATVTSGATSEIRKLHAGQFVRFNGNGPYEIRDVVGSTIYLHADYASTTATSSMVSYSAPVFQKTGFGYSAAPVAGTWTQGDVVWFDSSGGVPGAFCTASGAPGTWESMGQADYRDYVGMIPTVAVNVALVSHFTVTATSGQTTPTFDNVITALNLPPVNTEPTRSPSRELTLCLMNASGGAMGIPTLDAAVFKTAGALVLPANGYTRCFTFGWNGTHMVEKSRNAADIPN